MSRKRSIKYEGGLPVRNVNVRMEEPLYEQVKRDALEGQRDMGPQMLYVYTLWLRARARQRERREQTLAAQGTDSATSAA